MVDMIAPVKDGDSATRIGKSFTECVEQARLWTSLSNQLTSEGSCCVSCIRKVRFSLAIRMIVDFMSVSFSDRFRQRNASSYDHRTGNGMYWLLLYICTCMYMSYPDLSVYTQTFTHNYFLPFKKREWFSDVMVMSHGRGLNIHCRGLNFFDTHCSLSTPVTISIF